MKHFIKLLSIFSVKNIKYSLFNIYNVNPQLFCDLWKDSVLQWEEEKDEQHIGSM